MSAWGDELAPPGLAALARNVRTAFGLSVDAVGMKGDDNHTYGYHRSRRWIYESGDGAGDYSVQLAADQGGDANWYSAMDVSLDEVRMIAVTGRIITALKARDPRVAAVREVFGTLDGETVTGWDAANRRPSTADDSHLWHLHLSFYRSRAGDDHAGVLAVLLGNPLEDDMPLTNDELYGIISGVVNGSTAAGYIDQTAPPAYRSIGKYNVRALDGKLDLLLRQLGVAQADIDELQARPTGLTDAQVKELAAALAAEADAGVVEQALVDVLGRVGLTVRPA